MLQYVLSTSRARWRTLVSLLVIALVVAACDSGGQDRASKVVGTSDDAFPVTVISGPMASSETVELESRPQSIVSLSPTATEMLWAIGAGDQVVAVDEQSDYPREVPTTSLSGYEPNVEAVLNYQPDLVIASYDGGDLQAGLEAVDVPVLLMPTATDLDEAYSQLERIGEATGHAAQADEVVSSMRLGIAEAVAAATKADGWTYFHELGPDLYTVTSETFVGEIYSMFGLKSIADAAGGEDSYPQLSDEFVVSSDPDFVFVADQECCNVTVAAVQERTGWGQMSAIRDGHVVAVDEDITSRWGPRIVEFVRAVSTTLAAAGRKADSLPTSP